MERFIPSCEQFLQYPQNLVQQHSLFYNLKAQTERLKYHGKRLFHEQQAAVDFWDLKCGDGGFHATCVTNLNELKEVLREACEDGKADPQCRFVFLHAPNSRAPLKITFEMLSFLFTYHQVIATFLDFVYPFGKQIQAQDFYFSSLREESCLDEKRPGLSIPELGRSGKELRFCYNLRSVEPAKSQGNLPWSIRQCAMYHSFDLITGRSVWINVKANRLIKERIKEASTRLPWYKTGSRSESFSASLGTHLLLCDWSCENWRWYINDLEDRFHEYSANALALPVERPPTPISSPNLTTPSHAGIDKPHLPRIVPWKTMAPSPGSPGSQWCTFSPTAPSRSPTLVEKPDHIEEASHCFKHTRWAELASTSSIKSAIASAYAYLTEGGRKSPTSKETELEAPPIKEKEINTDRLQPPEQPPVSLEEHCGESNEIFSFKNVQEVQQIEDRAHEVSLVLKQNARVFGELREHYKYSTKHVGFPSDLRSDCELDLERFYRCVLSAENDTLMLQSRIETLLRLISNRKSLLNEVLHYRSIKANEYFNKRAHFITLEMHTIAKKTEQETVSMRVITTVTLFFLPATFIATFMSANILDFKDGGGPLQIRALRVYLAVVLPLTAITFLMWYVIYRRAKRRSQRDTGQLSGVSLPV